MTFAKTPARDALPGIPGNQQFGARRAAPGINTHLLADPGGDGPEGSTIRRAQARQLEHLEQVVAGNPRPVLVGGDFNFPAGSPELDRFLARAWLTNLFAGSCEPTIRERFLPAGATASRIAG